VSGVPGPTSPVLDSEDALDKAVRTYQNMGYSDCRVASLILRSGFTPEAVQRRFPHLSVRELLPHQRGADLTPTHTPLLSGPSNKVRSISQSGQLQTAVKRIPAHEASVEHPENPPSPVQKADPTALEDGLSFQYVPLIQCTFPHADPGEQTLFTRRNGRLELTLSTSRPDIGLPYGVPARLLTIFCSSEAKRTESPRIELGASVQDFLRRLDLPITRGDRGSLRVYTNQLLRLSYWSITVDERLEDEAGRNGVDIRPMRFVDRARLWWDQDAELDQDSYLILSPEIYASILERSAPLSTRVIRSLRKSPMDLDVYAWLVHRLYKRPEASSVSWEQLSGQFGHTYGEIRYFRRFFCASLTKAMQAYPEARVKVTDTGLLLLPSKPHVAPRGEISA
jgi:Plasmid encoded RepA protein